MFPSRTYVTIVYTFAYMHVQFTSRRVCLCRNNDVTGTVAYEISTNYFSFLILKDIRFTPLIRPVHAVFPRYGYLKLLKKTTINYTMDSGSFTFFFRVFSSRFQSNIS